MHDLLLSMAAAAQEWRHRGVKAVPSGERNEWIAQYFELLAQGYAAQPAFSPEEVSKQRGRRKQSAAKNLLDELLRRAEQVLAFLDDLSIPFTNNQAERDLRMVSRATKDLRQLSRVATGPQRFVAFAVISRRCANRNMPCWLPWRRSLSASLPDRLGHRSCYKIISERMTLLCLSPEC